MSLCSSAVPSTAPSERALLVAVAAAGVPLQNRGACFVETEGHPVGTASSVVDRYTALHATIGTLAALRHRERTGKGAHVTTSLLAEGIWSASVSIQAALSARRDLKPESIRRECEASLRRLGVERLEAGGGRALVTFAPSTPVTPERILVVLGRPGSGVTTRKEFMLEAMIPTGPWEAVRDALRALLESLA